MKIAVDFEADMAERRWEWLQAEAIGQLAWDSLKAWRVPDGTMTQEERDAAVDLVLAANRIKQGLAYEESFVVEREKFFARKGIVNADRGQVEVVKSFYGTYQVVGGLGNGRQITLHESTGRKEAEEVAGFIGQLRAWPDKAKTLTEWLDGVSLNHGWAEQEQPSEEGKEVKA